MGHRDHKDHEVISDQLDRPDQLVQQASVDKPDQPDRQVLQVNEERRDQPARQVNLDQPAQ